MQILIDFCKCIYTVLCEVGFWRDFTRFLLVFLGIGGFVACVSVLYYFVLDDFLYDVRHLCSLAGQHSIGIRKD